MLGGRFDIRLTHFLWITSQMDFRLKNSWPASSVSGGRFMVGSFGAKIGKEKRRIGLFGDVRGGFLSWSDVVTFLESYVSIKYGRLTRPFVYFGGTGEIYASKRIGFRVTVGDAFNNYPKVTIVPGVAPFNGFTANNLQVSSGVFYRF
jgi:hypothetical protein